VIAEQAHKPPTRFHMRYRMARAMLLLVSGEVREAAEIMQQVMAASILDSDPSLRDDATGVWALALLASGDVKGARDVLDESRLFSQDAWCAIDRQLIDAAVSIAAGRTERARLAQIASQCHALGNFLYEARAQRLAQAHAPPFTDYPRLMWVNGTTIN
jgi:hypothetical protein